MKNHERLQLIDIVLGLLCSAQEDLAVVDGATEDDDCCVAGANRMITLSERKLVILKNSLRSRTPKNESH